MHHQTSLLPDAAQKLARLSAEQRQCLHLVSRNMQSKEIARVLGKSSHTVDQRMREVLRVLDVSTRLEAARLLRAHEGEVPQDEYQDLIDQAPALTPRQSAGRRQASFGHTSQPNDGSRHELHEVQSPYNAGLQPFHAASFLSAWTAGTQNNRLSPQARLVAVIAIAVLAVGAMAALVSIAEGISRIT